MSTPVRAGTSVARHLEQFLPEKSDRQFVSSKTVFFSVRNASGKSYCGEPFSPKHHSKILIEPDSDFTMGRGGVKLYCFIAVN